MFGWAGTILKVDLTSGKIEKIPLAPEFAQKYIGGSGFAAATFFDLVKPETDALSPDNALILAAGPLSGTAYPGNSRLTIAAKSPLTGLYGDSNIGESFAAELKKAGYDEVIITGKASKPVFIWIKDGQVELRDAAFLWGKNTSETGALITEKLENPRAQLVCIGQAGENLVRFACIITPPKGAAGRGGLGAVMGSKNLKAVVVRGTGKVAVFKPVEFKKVCKETVERLKVTKNCQALSYNGTLVYQDQVGPSGMAGVRNFQKNFVNNLYAISGERFKKEFALPQTHCYGCPVGCRTHYEVKSGEYAGLKGGGPEFGLLQIGFRCDISSMEGLLMLNQLFNDYGLDCVSAGALFAWAMDCNERGILTAADFGDTPLAWGDYHASINMTHKITRREGFGEILAEGEDRAPRIVGRGSEKYMYTLKGRAPVVEDPRTNRQFGLAYYTSLSGEPHLKANTGRIPDLFQEGDIADWLREPETLNPRNPKNKGKLVKLGEDCTQVVDCAGICTRTGGTMKLISRALSLATGIEFTEAKLLETGERAVNVQKALNSRQGLTRKDDNFSSPEKFTNVPVPEGPYQGDVIELDMMLDEYYQARGWDIKTGLQTRRQLTGLNLENLIPELEKRGGLGG